MVRKPSMANSTLMNQSKQVKGEFMNNPDGTTSYYDAITGVKLVDTSLVVDGQTFVSM